ncbi:MAG: sigma-70 family RNA polymerase sigma factor [Flavobacteriaceae bacterium]|nr:sigma-70 family RNA polymerase sigma factor [Flavobacteriaceae bacterium]
MTNNDQYFIEQLQAGNTAVFADLVDTYKNLVFSLALRMLKQTEEAEEVSQDTFIKVFKGIDKFKSDSKLSTWIYRITYNSCLDRLKSKRREFMTVEIDEHNANKIGDVGNAFEVLAQKEREEAIRECLAKLPPDDAALLTLFYFEEKKLQEIEKITDLSVNTIKVRLFRARKRLAGIMQDHLEPEILQHYG